MNTAAPARSLGADLRALRKSRGRTLAEIAAQLGRSVGWMSQVERDLSEPSISDLREIAAASGVPLSMLFAHAPAPAAETGYVVRQAARRPIGSTAAGLVEELLSPDLTDDFEVVHSTFAPRSEIADAVTRPTQEVGYLVSGRLDLEIGAARFTITPGDSFRIRGEPFRWINPYDVPAIAIWVIAPPSIEEVGMVTGSCLCGAVRYTLTGDLRPSVACHCSQCRKTSGHYWSATQVPAGQIAIQDDGDALRWFQSSKRAQRGFCSLCGSSLFWRHADDNGATSVGSGTLDGPTGMRTAKHIHLEDKGDYYDIANDLTDAVTAQT